MQFQEHFVDMHVICVDKLWHRHELATIRQKYVDFITGNHDWSLSIMLCAVSGISDQKGYCLTLSGSQPYIYGYRNESQVIAAAQVRQWPNVLRILETKHRLVSL